MNVLVAGGAGYIGSHMVKALVRAGHAATVLDNLSTGHADAVRGAALVRGDLRSRADIEAVLDGARFDAVMHFAAFIEAGESMKDPGRFYQNNLVNSLHLIETAVESYNFV